MGWKDIFKKAGGYATKGFEWIEDYPETADMIAGIVEGGAAAYVAVTEGEANREAAKEEAEKQRQHDLDMQQNQVDNQAITPVSIDNYGSHNGLVTDGLITKGMISGKQEPKQKSPDARRHRFQ